MFYSVYLLNSERKGYQSHTYIGSTPDPIKRIRQHNQEIKEGGAKKTSKKGPWKMIMFVWGFQSKYDALCFEWSWQHPGVSRHLKELTHRSDRLTGALESLISLINSPRWSRYPLNLHLFEPVPFPHDLQLPTHILVSYTPFSDFKLKDLISEPKSDVFQISLSKECLICYEKLDNAPVVCRNRGCSSVFHDICLAEWFLHKENLPGALLPVHGTCPNCRSHTRWVDWITSEKVQSDVEDEDTDNEDYKSGQDEIIN